MKINKIFLRVFLLLILLFLIGIFFNLNLSPVKDVKSKISWKTKEIITRYILPYRYISRLENEIISKDKIIVEKNLLISELKNDEVFELYNLKNLSKKLKLNILKTLIL